MAMEPMVQYNFVRHYWLLLFVAKRRVFMNHGDVAWILTSSALVLIMTPGLAFFYGGLVKRKNIINTIMSSAVLMGIGSIMWVLIGFTFLLAAIHLALSVT